MQRMPIGPAPLSSALRKTVGRIPGATASTRSPTITAARVRLGGDGGVVLDVKAGDALLLPAGVGHQNLGASADLLVIGAYPKG